MEVSLSPLRDGPPLSEFSIKKIKGKNSSLPPSPKLQLHDRPRVPMAHERVLRGPLLRRHYSEGGERRRQRKERRRQTATTTTAKKGDAFSPSLLQEKRCCLLFSLRGQVRGTLGRSIEEERCPNEKEKQAEAESKRESRKKEESEFSALSFFSEIQNSDESSRGDSLLTLFPTGEKTHSAMPPKPRGGSISLSHSLSREATAAQVKGGKEAAEGDTKLDDAIAIIDAKSKADVAALLSPDAAALAAVCNSDEDDDDDDLDTGDVTIREGKGENGGRRRIEFG